MKSINTSPPSATVTPIGTGRPWLARLPPGLFAIVFGLLGLAGAWGRLSGFGITTNIDVVAMILLISATGLLVLLLLLNVIREVRHRVEAANDRAHPVQGALLSLLPLTILLSVALWLPSDRVVTQIGALNSFASFGSLCATAPLAALVAGIGWRESYWIFTGAVALIMLAVALVMRDAPPGARPSSAKDERLAEILAGVREAVRQPGMKRLLVAGLPMSAASTIAGVWGAPYLKDVHALDDIGRGGVLLTMALCGMSGHYLYGRLARRLNTLKWPIVVGGLIVLAVTGALACLEHPPLWLVTALFCILGIASAYPTITHAQARGLVPARLMGRGVSVTNMGVMTAVAVMQLAFGAIVGAFPAVEGVPPEYAYRMGFAVQAAMALIGILIYAPIRDVKPRG